MKEKLSAEELLGRIALGVSIEAGLAKDTDPRAREAEKIIRGQRLELEEELKSRGNIEITAGGGQDRPSSGPNDVVIQLQAADISAVPNK
jgi:hypothetical protein